MQIYFYLPPNHPAQSPITGLPPPEFWKLNAEGCKTWGKSVTNLIFVLFSSFFPTPSPQDDGHSPAAQQGTARPSHHAGGGPQRASIRRGRRPPGTAGGRQTSRLQVMQANISAH